MAVESTPRKSGGRTLVEIDLLEISATSTPMHPSARALSWKTANQYDMSEFDAMIDSSRKHTAEFRERWRKRLRDHEILEIAAKAEREEAKTARADRPIRVKRFEIG